MSVDMSVDILFSDEVGETVSSLITDDFIDVFVEEILAELTVDKLGALSDHEVVA